MQQKRRDEEDEDEDASLVAGDLELNPLMAAALVGGALAAGAGAYIGARALAKRNSESGRVNSTLATAITASECSHGKPAAKRKRG